MTDKKAVLTKLNLSTAGVIKTKSTRSLKKHKSLKHIKIKCKKTNSKKLQSSNAKIKKKQKVYGLFYDDCLYHKQYQDKCKTVRFMKVPTQENSARKAPGLLGKNKFKKQASTTTSKGELSYYKVSGMTIKQMNQLTKLVNHPRSKIKFVFLDFDRTITVHDGFYNRKDFKKLYLKPLKWRLPLNPYGAKNTKKKLIDLRYGDRIPAHSANSQLHCFRKYYFGGDARLNKFIQTMNELIKKKIKIYVVTANKKSVVANFMNCARMKFYRKIYSQQDYKKKQKYDIIKAIMLKFKMPVR